MRYGATCANATASRCSRLRSLPRGHRRVVSYCAIRLGLESERGERDWVFWALIVGFGLYMLGLPAFRAWMEW